MECNEYTKVATWSLFSKPSKKNVFWTFSQGWRTGEFGDREGYQRAVESGVEINTLYLVHVQLNIFVVTCIRCGNIVPPTTLHQPVTKTASE